MPSFPNVWNTHFKIFKKQKSKSSISNNNIFEHGLILFLGFLKYLGVLNIKNNCFGESWSRPPGPRTIKMRGLGVSQ